jgi:hypothetical protein
MHPPDDTRVAEARQRLAGCPADPQITTMSQGELAQLAVRLHGAAQLLNAHIRDTRARTPAPPAASPHTALTLDRGQAATVLAALDDAAALRRETASFCPECTRSPAGLCPDHERSLDAADEYDTLRRQLHPALDPIPPAGQQSATQPGQHGEPSQHPKQRDEPLAAAMACPECGEPAIGQEPVDPVPWQAHGMTRPQWSHTDGSALCPVPGPSGGYRPAQPVPAAPRPEPAPAPQPARAGSPSSMRHHGPASAAERSAEAGEVERRAAEHQAAAAQCQRLVDARDTHPGSVPWQHLCQGWQHRETTGDRLRHAEAAAGQDGAEAEAGA